MNQVAQRGGAPQGRDLVDAPRAVFSEERRQPVGVLGAATLGVRPRRRPAAPPSASTSCAFRDDECDSGCAPMDLAMAD